MSMTELFAMLQRRLGQLISPLRNVFDERAGQRLTLMSFDRSIRERLVRA